MKIVDNNFKDDIRTYGRQFDFKIKLDNKNEDIDNFNTLKPAFHGSLFKTIMHELELDSKKDIAKNTKINIKAGVRLNETNYQYVNYNTYSALTSERQEDNNSYLINSYDKMAESMIDYDLEVTEKLTLRNYLIKIFTRLGWDTSHIPATFINSNKLVDPNLHRGIDYSFRDALDELTTISCSFILFRNDEPYLIYPTQTNINIDESYLDEDNVTIGEKFFINSLVFSRAEESDNIYRKDDNSIAQNGLHEYRISDNQLLSTNDRDLYIDEMFNYLKTLEFYTFDVKSKGILFLEACDCFNYFLNGKTYPTILLNNEIEFDDGLSETLYTEAPEETETEYKYADSTDKKINQTYILVDKQNQKITQLANQTTEHEEKLTQVEQDIDSIKQTVKDSIEYKRTVDGVTQIHLEEAGQADILELEVKGNKQYNNYLYPSPNLYPSQNLYPNDSRFNYTEGADNSEIYDNS